MGLPASSSFPTMISPTELAAANSDAIRFPLTDPPEPGMAVEIADGVFWLRFPLPMALNHVNVYAFRDADGWTIVDTGIDSSLTRKIWRDVMAGPFGGMPVHRVVVTHHHPDHVGLIGWFKSEFGAEIVVTRVAWLMARMLTLDVQPRQTPEAIQFYREAGVPEDIMAARNRQRPFNFADIVCPIPVGFRRIEDGDTIAFGGRQWLVRTGGGHAPEHATFWCKDAGLIVGGDQFLAEISPNIGVYPTEPDADPLLDWLESCIRFRKHADNGSLVLVGHKIPYTGLAVRLGQLIENHHSALARLLQELNRPKAAAECLDILYKREIREDEYGLAIVEAVAHLNHLFHRGHIARSRRGDGAWLYVAS